MAFSIAAMSSALFISCKHNAEVPTPGISKGGADNVIPGATLGINKVGHVVVIYLENHSFDNLYGQFAGANGLSAATSSMTLQIDANGAAYNNLPSINSQFPVNLPNTYFNIDQYVSSGITTPDVLHRFNEEQTQINGGKMNKFALINSSGGLAMGYYKTSLLPLQAMAQKYTLCDNFFHSALGGSFLNHQWLIAAASPKFPNAPATVINSGQVTGDGYVVNTSYSVNTPNQGGTQSKQVPYQTNPTIGDRLSDKNISWAWYAGGWDDILKGKDDNNFQYHHQPFLYYAKYADGTQAKKDHLKDENNFIEAAKNGTLPSVSFVKPVGKNNEHPGYANLLTGENHTLDLINTVLNGPNGKDAVIIVAYDENGGFWDHVAPPVIDRWGPGTRVPALIISPFAKKGFVDHTQYETVSILSFIEKRWGLQPLTDRDKNADPMLNAFEF